MKLTVYKPQALMIAICMFSALIGLSCSKITQDWDSRLTANLRILFRLGSAPSGELAAQTFPEIVALVILATAAYTAAYRLEPRNRKIILVQLAVLSFLVQWFFLSMNLSTSLIAFLCTIVVACLGAALLKHFEEQQALAESRNSELILNYRQLQEARLQMVKADEVDRRMLAADLHDQVLNDLKSVAQKVKSLKQNPREDTAKEIDILLHKAMANVREVMDSLTPSTIEHLGFAAGLEDCVRQAAAKGSLRVRMRNSVDPAALAKLSQIEEILLFRLVQEACNNIVKHAQASRISCTMDFLDRQLVIQVEDDGCGLVGKSVRSESRGLTYMRQRADLLGAVISWLPGHEGLGTLVEIRMPLQEYV